MFFVFLAIRQRNCSSETLKYTFKQTLQSDTAITGDYIVWNILKRMDVRLCGIYYLFSLYCAAQKKRHEEHTIPNLHFDLSVKVTCPP